MSQKIKYGWKRDLPDFRDFTTEHEQVKLILNKMPVQTSDVPTSVDLSNKFSPVENQGDIGSCTANAAAGIYEYFMLNTQQKYINVSRLFLYYGARYLGGLFPGDNGAEIRNVMGALVLFGACPEKFWPYNVKNVDTVPPQACFSLGQSFQALTYFRLDSVGKTKEQILVDIKTQLANNIPVIFGFTCYNSLDNHSVSISGEIPFPSHGENMDGGHAVIIAGYNDSKVIVHPVTKQTTIGAVMIRNSWGNGWGRNGYGWLPYDYILKGLATDFWVMISGEWVDADLFI